MRYINEFIGADEANEIVKFIGSDQENVFLDNIEKQSNDWLYRNINISYHYNENGHRCKNIQEIDLDNYILFTGCSMTEGHGLRLEDTYPHIVSNRSRCDYYNLGLGGTGLDVLLYNIVIWFNTVKKLPKAVIIQWPHTVRYSRILNTSSDELYIKQTGPWSDKHDRTLGEFITIGDKIGYFKLRSISTYNMIYHITKHTKLILIESYAESNLKCLSNTKEMPHVFFNIFDKARDIVHPGIKSNLKLAEKLMSHLE
jgi:hypothetical protein